MSHLDAIITTLLPERVAQYAKENMQERAQLLFAGLAVMIASVIMGVFMMLTGIASNPFILFFAVAFLLAPFRHTYRVVKRFLLLSALIFLYWAGSEVVVLLTPFFLSFFIAYLCDPIVSALARKHVPRWLSAMVVVLMIVGSIAAVSVLFFPLIFAQFNDIIRGISTFVNDTMKILEERNFIRLMTKYGVSNQMAKEVLAGEVLPRLRGSLDVVVQGVLGFLTGLSSILSQVVNVIVVPILAFYFLKDFDALKRFIRSALEPKNVDLLHTLRRVNSIVQTYLGGQAIGAVFVGVNATWIYTVLGFPYSLVLGVITGLLNPIPYIGIFVSMLVAMVVVAVVKGGNVINEIFMIAGIVNGLHIIDTYVLQPRIVGSKVGLHPLMLIGSLFVFGHFFGFLGLIGAVPIGATCMMFLNDWLERSRTSNSHSSKQDFAASDVTDNDGSANDEPQQQSQDSP